MAGTLLPDDLRWHVAGFAHDRAVFAAWWPRHYDAVGDDPFACAVCGLRDAFWDDPAGGVPTLLDAHRADGGRGRWHFRTACGPRCADIGDARAAADA